MNTVRITMHQAELDEVLAFLHHYAQGRTPAKVRLAMGLTEQGKVVAQLIPTLCARLIIRLSTARLSVKEQYKMKLPGEMAMALVYAWLEQGGSKWPRAQVLIGNLHRNLA